MQKSWTGKNLDLDLLSNSVEDFFKDRGFLTRKIESAGERTILWAPERVGINLKESLRVTILGEPNSFSIELLASELTKRSIRLGILTKPIGGGYFLLKSLKLREALEKIEHEFWTYVEDRVADLAGSAKQS